ncbi:FAD-dependent oxidoreductase [Salipaludibacillus daqingensis]|uniref:FAD-dependent oxidoreductase n=1 Tax=Salipaludibacillus daqingensis TaxID=3041001 RepID=UPI0024767DAB|nr:NAD(P)-binding protein [Salipaludibacillus daqingensis]
MKVAIIGAGFSGLCAAITLEKHGIFPDIFEIKEEVGDLFDCGHVLFSNLSPLTGDVVRYMTEEHGIIIRPDANIRKLTVFSEREQVSIHGQFGYFIQNSQHKPSISLQLKEQIKTPIHFNSKVSYEELLHEYSHVLVATAEPEEFTAKIGLFEKEKQGSLTWKNIKGNFDRYELTAWLDNNIAPKGYGFLIPYNSKEACLGISIPSKEHIGDGGLDHYWETFMERAEKNLQMSFHVPNKKYQANDRATGLCRYPRIGNTFFIGACYSSALPYIGAGYFTHMLTGVYAAQDLLGMGEFENLTKPIWKTYHQGIVARDVWSSFDNRDFDFIVKLVQRRLTKKAITGEYNLLSLITRLIKPSATFSKPPK